MQQERDEYRPRTEQAKRACRILGRVGESTRPPPPMPEVLIVVAFLYTDGEHSRRGAKSMSGREYLDWAHLAPFLDIARQYGFPILAQRHLALCAVKSRSSFQR